MKLHVTNWSSRRLHGPGRKWTIMTAPRRWERGEGCVWALTPRLEDLRDMREGFLSPRAYRDRCVARFTTEGGALDPGFLTAALDWDHTHECGSDRVPVAAGDTLCCACSREAAARGECHRVWAAELLRRAGWRVVLDGRELAGVGPDWGPVFVGVAE